MELIDDSTDDEIHALGLIGIKWLDELVGVMVHRDMAAWADHG